jgi:uncharacterized membrane protein YeaQ/YmgE (transglycosylase-associated protein family)
MNITTWIMIGLIIGVLSTAWQPTLTLKGLVIAMVVGMIGSLSGGVVGYLLYGSSIDGFDISVFSTALIVIILSTITRKKAKEYTFDLGSLKKDSTLSNVNGIITTFDTDSPQIGKVQTPLTTPAVL